MRKASVGKPLLILGAGAAGILLAAQLWMRAAIEQTWESLGHRVEELARQSSESPAARPVLRGEPLDGDAWDDYEPALAAFEARAFGKDLARAIRRYLEQEVRH